MKGESLITDSLRPAGIWNTKLINVGFGTVFDKLILPPGHGYGVEVKVRQAPKIEFSKIEPNERKGLDKFMKQVGKNHAYIIGIWLTEDTKRAFLIPWHEVRDAVCSGARGSINMLEFPELPRTKGAWDLKMIWEVSVR